MNFLNRLFVKCIYSEAPVLNLTPYDMGEDMISASLDDEVVTRLKTAVGTVGSLAIVVSVTIEIAILKTSPAFPEYVKRILENAYIGGTLTIYDDVNTPYVISDVSLDVGSIPNMNGQNAAVTFKIQGNMQVNRSALGI